MAARLNKTILNKSLDILKVISFFWILVIIAFFVKMDDIIYFKQLNNSDAIDWNNGPFYTASYIPPYLKALSKCLQYSLILNLITISMDIISKNIFSSSYEPNKKINLAFYLSLLFIFFILYFNPKEILIWFI